MPTSSKQPNIILFLDNIRSLQNVGAIFRSAAGFGVQKIILSGITGTPPRKEISKTALGAELETKWEHADNLQFEILNLKKEGFTVAALEITPTAIPIQNYLISPIPHIALIVGNEVEGINSETLSMADIHLMINMTNKIRSFNVATATAVALYELTKGSF